MKKRDKLGRFVYTNGNGYRHWMINKESKCEWCGNKGYLEVDHIDMDKTNNTRSNLRVLCHPCHTKRHKLKTWDRAGNTGCIECGRSDIKSDGKGLCHNCYQRKWRNGEFCYV